MSDVSDDYNMFTWKSEKEEEEWNRWVDSVNSETSEELRKELQLRKKVSLQKKQFDRMYSRKSYYIQVVLVRRGDQES